MMRIRLLAVVVALVAFAASAPRAALSGEPKSPADGYDIHVIAPHVMAHGEPGGPFHHYCKPISDKILQCLLYESTDPKAKLVGIEYFVAKDLTRKLPAIQWHRHFHDHRVEIATGRVKVLDMPDDQAAKVAEAAMETDGVIYHLWQPGLEFPDGTVSFPQSVGHQFPGHSQK
ncbi:MAG TPA: DUF1264 domain-containing protein [Nitrospira sp.]|nr:DUF1264 domain-containing protein [Nitrospira sp.]